MIKTSCVHVVWRNMYEIRCSCKYWDRTLKWWKMMNDDTINTLQTYLLIQAFRSHYCTGQSLRWSSLTFVNIHSISSIFDFYIFHKPCYTGVLHYFYTTFTTIPLFTSQYMHSYTKWFLHFWHAISSIFDFLHVWHFFQSYTILWRLLHLHFYYYFTIH